MTGAPRFGRLRPLPLGSLLLLGLALALASGGACGRGGPSGAPPLQPAPVTLGERCLDCHGDLVRAYRGTGMARALDPIVPGEFEGLHGFEEPATGFRYALVEEDGAPAFLEALAVSEERTVHRTTPLAFAIGAGVQDRAYASVRGGRMWFAPLEVVNDVDGRHAAPSPVLTITPGSRDSFGITEECLGCHTDTPPERTWPLNVLPDDWEPRGISCGACHGDVDGHAAWQESDLAGDDLAGDDPVLALGALDQIQRLSICAACHLQGDARIVLDPDRLGPPPPGGDLLEQRAVFVAAEPTNEVGFVSQVERLLLSRCFTESPADAVDGMTCGSCHDPHRSIQDPDERTRVRDGCLGCHPAGMDGAGPGSPCATPPAQRADQDCVACHMRRTPVFDVAHVEIHDHWIRGDPGPPSTPEELGPLRTPESPTGDWKRVAWPGRAAPPHADDPGLTMMALAHGGHHERALALADEPPGPTASALPMYHHVRGSLLERAGRGSEAYGAYGRALVLAPDFPPTLTNLGLLCAQLGKHDEGLAHLEKLIATYPRDDAALRNRAVLRERMGERDGVQQDLEAAFERLPSAEVAAALAAIHGRVGRLDLEWRWRARATELDPLSHPPRD